MKPPPPHTPPPLPLGYSTPQPRQPVDVLGWVRQYILWIAFGSIVTILCASVTPHYAQVFHDFKVTLPGITTAWLTATGLFTNGFLWIPFWLVCLLMPVILFLVNKGRFSGAGTVVSIRATRLILTLLTGLLIVLGMLAIYLPMATLVDAVSGSKK